MTTLRDATPWALACVLVLGPLSSLDAAEVVVLKSVEAPGWAPALQALRDRATNHRLVEVALGGSRAKAEQTLRALAGRDVILVALGPLAAEACRELVPQLPLAYALVPHPERIPNLAGAVGVAYEVPVKNQLAAFRMVNPRAVRIGVLHSAEVDDEIAEVDAAAGVLRLAMVTRSIGSERDVPDALRKLLGEVDAIWLPADPVLVGESMRRFVLAESLKRSKPVYAFSSALVAEGALVSNGASLVSVGSQLAEIVDRIAGGESPEQIGQRVPAAELVINSKIAQRLNIEIPADALRSAAKVH